MDKIIDNWEDEFNEKWVNKSAHLTPNPAQGVYCGNKNEIMDFIRQNFISKKELREKIDKITTITHDDLCTKKNLECILGEVKELLK